MAVPLPATLQPIEQPFPLAVGAEAVIIYDTGSDTSPEDNIHIDFYTSGGIEPAIIGVILAAERYLPNHPAKAAGTIGDFFGASPAQVSADFFVLTTTTPVIEVIFFWEDVASFFWWSSPYDEAEGYVEPSVGFDDFFTAAPEAEGNDFFSSVIVAPE